MIKKVTDYKEILDNIRKCNPDLDCVKLLEDSKSFLNSYREKINLSMTEILKELTFKYGLRPLLLSIPSIISINMFLSFEVYNTFILQKAKEIDKKEYEIKVQELNKLVPEILKEFTKELKK